MADIWGVLFQLHGARVRSAVPGWLASAAASYASMDFIDACARELNENPSHYGYDPSGTYTVLVQTWDRSTLPLSSLAFGRSIVGHDDVRMIPDVYYIHHNGYAQLRHEATERPPWRERHNTLAWRGSVTGSGPYEAAELIPRVALAIICKGIEGVDVALTGVHSTMESIFPPSRIATVIEEQGLYSPGWPMARFGDYKYVINIDGHANAWALLEMMILGCCVLKVDSPYEQWFYHRLRPWVHYVPITRDLSDLEGRLAWCRENEATCEWIARNGATLAASLSLKASIEHSCRELLLAADLS